VDRDDLIDRRLGRVMEQREGENGIGPQVPLEDGFLRRGAGREQAAPPEAQGRSGDFAAAVEQAAGIGVVMGFGGRQLLGPRRESRQVAEVIALEVGASRPGQFLDPGDGLPPASEQLAAGKNGQRADRQSERSERAGTGSRRLDWRTACEETGQVCGRKNPHGESGWLAVKERVR
jgi:hypothetical protein